VPKSGCGDEKSCAAGNAYDIWSGELENAWRESRGVQKRTLVRRTGVSERATGAASIVWCCLIAL
jgi:hypothetical protein